MVIASETDERNLFYNRDVGVCCDERKRVLLYIRFVHLFSKHLEGSSNASSIVNLKIHKIQLQAQEFGRQTAHKRVEEMQFIKYKT